MTKQYQYRLGSSNFCGAPGMIAWAINGAKFERDRAKMVDLVASAWAIPTTAAEALLTERVPHKIEGDVVVFEVERPRDPFNPDAHAHLTALGYAWTPHEENWYDDGDPESGPHLSGNPAWDQYTSHEDYVHLDARGCFAHYEARDHALEAWIDENVCDGSTSDEVRT